MEAAIETLTSREKETLRLLLAGHDAKSIAREFNLSVHTINDRLREARRKLQASSSREAARILAQQEAAPNFVAPQEIGIAEKLDGVQLNGQPGGPERKPFVVAWLGGGLLVLILVFAALAFSINGSDTASSKLAAQSQTLTNVGQAQPASAASAREWLALIDARNWNDSWREAGSMFRSQISQQGWASTIAPVRNPLGAPTSRSIGKVTKTASLPGAPSGEYELLEFQTNFANRRGAVETVVLTKEGTEWRVVGYFIR